MRNIARTGVVLGVMALGAVIWHYASTSNVDADDASRTSSLLVKQYDFDGNGAESSLVAELHSNSNDDVYAHITVFWTVPGGQEEEGATTSTQRLQGDPNLYLSYALPVTEFPSGTQVRAVFDVKDVNGGNTMSGYQRVTTIP